MRAVLISGKILFASSSVLESIQCASARTIISGCFRATDRRCRIKALNVRFFCRCGVKDGNDWVIVGGTEDQINFEITPTTNEPPRVGVSAKKLVEPWYYAKMSDEEKQKLEYLFFEDGAVAGAHAYTTYFGRDPLITAAALLAEAGRHRDDAGVLVLRP